MMRDHERMPTLRNHPAIHESIPGRSMVGTMLIPGRIVHVRVTDLGGIAPVSARGKSQVLPLCSGRWLATSD